MLAPPFFYLHKFCKAGYNLFWEAPIIVGKTTMFFPGDPRYDAVMATFADDVAHWPGYEEGVGLSGENLERYRNEWRLLITVEQAIQSSP